LISSVPDSNEEATIDQVVHETFSTDGERMTDVMNQFTEIIATSNEERYNKKNNIVDDVVETVPKAKVLQGHQSAKRGSEKKATV
jgi:poly(3-hydroxyalkanoate) synthetase